jgi:DNA-binding response OmpR family regulator
MASGFTLGTSGTSHAPEHWILNMIMGTRTVLVVEDDNLQYFALAEHLKAAGYDVHGSSSVKFSSVAADVCDPDCIVVDLGLLDGSGVDLIKSLRANASYKKTPIVVHTSHNLSTLEKMDLQWTTQRIVFKQPGSLEEVVSEVKKAIESRI